MCCLTSIERERENKKEKAEMQDQETVMPLPKKMSQSLSKFPDLIQCCDPESYH